MDPNTIFLTAVVRRGGTPFTFRFCTAPGITA